MWSPYFSSLRSLALPIGLFCLHCTSSGTRAVNALPAVSAATKSAQPAPVAFDLADANAALLTTRYLEAEGMYRQLQSKVPAAALGLARVLLETGRARESLSVLRPLVELPQWTLQARTRSAVALKRLGQWEASRQMLLPVKHAPDARAARLLLGELSLRCGNRAEATGYLMSLIGDYNDDRVATDDPDFLQKVGRAAHLLRSPEDANDAFNAAEQAQGHSSQLMLWRAELFLQKHDPAQAEQVLRGLLATAPHRADALVLMAQVKLDQAMDFGAAKQMANRALTIDPEAAGAHFVLAGIELRDLGFSEAHHHVDAGLLLRPASLPLLSMRAAIAFLQDDDALFERVKHQVFSVNPVYSEFYSVVGKYAEWEHRYVSIVEMMKEAVQLDDADAAAHAALGFNLIRSGQEEQGVAELRRAFAEDPFDVRVFNTLGLYEKTIPTHYESETKGHFRIRYPKVEKALLQRYIPALLEAGWQRFSQFYQFEPAAPIGVELYSKREHFAVRTSGLPQTAISGVCFGQTLATLTPLQESLNLGMTLWHELAHVFHIQLSRSHVPRWLTEGLAEHETLQERAEWSRHLDLPLFRARRAGRLPSVTQMNRAFSGAENLEDVSVAYYTSNQIASWIVEREGRGAVVSLLQQYAKGGSAQAILRRVLAPGKADSIDSQFGAYLDRRLKGYAGQFVPIEPRGSLSKLQLQAQTRSSSVTAFIELAAMALREHRLPLAESALKRARALGPESPNVHFFEAKLAAALDEPERAVAGLRGMITAGKNGYAIQMAIAELLRLIGSAAEERAALISSNEFDPAQSAPLMRLWLMARSDNDAAKEIQWLQRLADLEPHQGRIVQRLLSLLLAAGRPEDAAKRGPGAIFVDLENPRIHTLYAQALAALGRHSEAEFEFESSLLCPGEDRLLAQAHLHYADYLRSQGFHRRASHHAEWFKSR